MGSSITVTNENSRMSSPHQDGQTDAFKARAHLMMLQDRIGSSSGTGDSRGDRSGSTPGTVDSRGNRIGSAPGTVDSRRDVIISEAVTEGENVVWGREERKGERDEGEGEGSVSQWSEAPEIGEYYGRSRIDSAEYCESPIGQSRGSAAQSRGSVAQSRGSEVESRGSESREASLHESVRESRRSSVRGDDGDESTLPASVSVSVHDEGSRGGGRERGVMGSVRNSRRGSVRGDSRRASFSLDQNHTDNHTDRHDDSRSHGQSDRIEGASRRGSVGSRSGRYLTSPSAEEYDESEEGEREAEEGEREEGQRQKEVRHRPRGVSHIEVETYGVRRGDSEEGQMPSGTTGVSQLTPLSSTPGSLGSGSRRGTTGRFPIPRQFSEESGEVREGQGERIGCGVRRSRYNEEEADGQSESPSPPLTLREDIEDLSEGEGSHRNRSTGDAVIRPNKARALPSISELDVRSNVGDESGHRTPITGGSKGSKGSVGSERRGAERKEGNVSGGGSMSGGSAGGRERERVGGSASGSRRGSQSVSYHPHSGGDKEENEEVEEEVEEEEEEVEESRGQNGPGGRDRDTHSSADASVSRESRRGGKDRYGDRYGESDGEDEGEGDVTLRDSEEERVSVYEEDRSSVSMEGSSRISRRVGDSYIGGDDSLGSVGKERGRGEGGDVRDVENETVVSRRSRAGSGSVVFDDQNSFESNRVYRNNGTGVASSVGNTRRSSSFSVSANAMEVDKEREGAREVGTSGTPGSRRPSGSMSGTPGSRKPSDSMSGTPGSRRPSDGTPDVSGTSSSRRSSDGTSVMSGTPGSRKPSDGTHDMSGTPGSRRPSDGTSVMSGTPGSRRPSEYGDRRSRSDSLSYPASTVTVSVSGIFEHGKTSREEMGREDVRREEVLGRVRNCPPSSSSPRRNSDSSQNSTGSNVKRGFREDRGDFTGTRGISRESWMSPGSSVAQSGSNSVDIRGRERGKNGREGQPSGGDGQVGIIMGGDRDYGEGQGGGRGSNYRGDRGQSVSRVGLLSAPSSSSSSSSSHSSGDEGERYEEESGNMGEVGRESRTEGEIERRDSIPSAMEGEGEGEGEVSAAGSVGSDRAHYLSPDKVVHSSSQSKRSSISSGNSSSASVSANAISGLVMEVGGGKGETGQTGGVRSPHTNQDYQDDSEGAQAFNRDREAAGCMSSDRGTPSASVGRGSERGSVVAIGTPSISDSTHTAHTQRQRQRGTHRDSSDTSPLKGGQGVADNGEEETRNHDPRSNLTGTGRQSVYGSVYGTASADSRLDSGDREGGGGGGGSHSDVDEGMKERGEEGQRGEKDRGVQGSNLSHSQDGRRVSDLFVREYYRAAAASAVATGGERRGSNPPSSSSSFLSPSTGHSEGRGRVEERGIRREEREIGLGSDGRSSIDDVDGDTDDGAGAVVSPLLNRSRQQSISSSNRESDRERERNLTPGGVRGARGESKGEGSSQLAIVNDPYEVHVEGERRRDMVGDGESRGVRAVQRRNGSIGGRSWDDQSREIEGEDDSKGGREGGGIGRERDSGVVREYIREQADRYQALTLQVEEEKERGRQEKERVRQEMERDREDKERVREEAERMKEQLRIITGDKDSVKEEKERMKEEKERIKEELDSITADKESLTSQLSGEKDKVRRLLTLLSAHTQGLGSDPFHPLLVDSQDGKTGGGGTGVSGAGRMVPGTPDRGGDKVGIVGQSPSSHSRPLSGSTPTPTTTSISTSYTTSGTTSVRNTGVRDSDTVDFDYIRSVYEKKLHIQDMKMKEQENRMKQQKTILSEKEDLLIVLEAKMREKEINLQRRNSTEKSHNFVLNLQKGKERELSVRLGESESELITLRVAHIGAIEAHSVERRGLRDQLSVMVKEMAKMKREYLEKEERRNKELEIERGEREEREREEREERERERERERDEASTVHLKVEELRLTDISAHTQRLEESYERRAKVACEERDKKEKQVECDAMYILFSWSLHVIVSVSLYRTVLDWTVLYRTVP
jgi:hypothetical protein